MHTEPQNEHRWLHQLIGDWTYEHEAAMPGQPAEKIRGRESVRSLGGLWVVCEGEGGMPGGGTAHTIMTLGYDPAKQHYVGVWIGSMMNNLWVYQGEVDSAGKALTLESEGPSFAGDGTMATYRDVIEFKSNDHRVLTSHVLGGDGQWRQFMTADYYRK